MSTYKSLVLTAKSPVVPRTIFKLEPEAGVIVIAPEAVMSDGVETEVAKVPIGATKDVPKYPVLGLVAPLAPMSRVLSVKSRLPVIVPPARGR